MRTDELIDILSTNLEPVDRQQVPRALASALFIGAAGVLAAMLLAFGVRTDLNGPGPVSFLLLKLLLTLGLVAVASALLTSLARPGGERKASVGMVALPFLGIMLVAVISLAVAPSSHWGEMIVGERWLDCLISIPIIAIVPFVIVVRALRKGAPTDLAKTGAFAGLLAGGLSATGYALHCTDDSLPFIALWYSATIAICTWIGSKLGPPLLRW